MIFIMPLIFLIRSKELGSAVRSKELSSAVSLIFYFMFSYIFFSVIIFVNSS